MINGDNIKKKNLEKKEDWDKENIYKCQRVFHKNLKGKTNKNRQD